MHEVWEPGTFVRARGHLLRVSPVGRIVDVHKEAPVECRVEYEVHWETALGNRVQREVARGWNWRDKGLCCWPEHSLVELDVVELLARLEDQCKETDS